MGLTIAVGLFAQNMVDGDEDECDAIEQPFRALNDVLAEHGMPPHDEPRRIAPEDYFERQMWGYNGIHALRRVAAHLELNGALPLFAEYGSYDGDPTLLEFNRLHEAYLTEKPKAGVISFLRRKGKRPPFQHLVMHSDAEGFYLPRQFDDVIVDWAEPQKLGLGMMIGSAASLLEECRVLAEALQVPDGFDPETDEFFELVDNPPTIGAPWLRLPVEGHTVANLIAACEASLRLGAAIQLC